MGAERAPRFGADPGSNRISSVLPRTPGQPRSRIRSITSAGALPPIGRSPPWRMRSGAASRRSTRTASRAMRLPCISLTIAIRTMWYTVSHEEDVHSNAAQTHFRTGAGSGGRGDDHYRESRPRGRRIGTLVQGGEAGTGTRHEPLLERVSSIDRRYQRLDFRRSRPLLMYLD